jgi:hypothetical protein
MDSPREELKQRLPWRRSLRIWAGAISDDRPYRDLMEREGGIMEGRLCTLSAFAPIASATRFLYEASAVQRLTIHTRCGGNQVLQGLRGVIDEVGSAILKMKRESI